MGRRAPRLFVAFCVFFNTTQQRLWHPPLYMHACIVMRNKPCLRFWGAKDLQACRRACGCSQVGLPRLYDTGQKSVRTALPGGVSCSDANGSSASERSIRQDAKQSGHGACALAQLQVAPRYSSAARYRPYSQTYTQAHPARVDHLQPAHGRQSGPHRARHGRCEGASTSLFSIHQERNGSCPDGTCCTGRPSASSPR